MFAQFLSAVICVNLRPTAVFRMIRSDGNRFKLFVRNSNSSQVDSDGQVDDCFTMRAISSRNSDCVEVRFFHRLSVERVCSGPHRK